MFTLVPRVGSKLNPTPLKLTVDGASWANAGPPSTISAQSRVAIETKRARDLRFTVGLQQHAARLEPRLFESSPARAVDQIAISSWDGGGSSTARVTGLRRELATAGSRCRSGKCPGAGSAVVPPTGFEPVISTLKGWRPRPLDDGGVRRV